MSPEQKVAYVGAQTACAMAEIAAMQTANSELALTGDFPAFTPDDFRAIPDRYAISHNAVLNLFRE